MSCRSGCPTGDHATWGECARSARIQIDRHGLQGHRKTERDKDRRLESYADLRKDGVQPKSTKWQHVRQAYETGGTRPTEVTSSEPIVSPAD